MPYPTVSFDPGETIVCQKAYISFTPAGVGATAINFIVKECEYTEEVETKERTVPQGEYLQADRIWPTTRKQRFKFTVEDIATVFTSVSGFLTGTATVWLTDRDDTTTCKLKTNAFAAILKRDGAMKFGGEDVVKGDFTLEATAPVTFTQDATP
jgi:hypothetical protein